MRKIKSLVLAVIGLLCSMSVSAHDFEVDGIYYNITSSTDMTVEVTYRGNSYYSQEYSGAVNIPESVTYNGKTYNVTSIESSAFYYCNRLTSVVIPNSVTSIGYSAFYYCTGLTSVEIPNSVTSIGSSAFLGCTGLTSVNIEDIVAWCNIEFESDGFSNPLCYAENLYLNDEKVTDLVIPNSVTSIGAYAFYNCKGMNSVTIPNNVTSIGRSAFGGCKDLKVHICDIAAWCNIDWDRSPFANKEGFYLNGEKIVDLTIPEGVQEIKSYAFYEWGNLKSVTIPSSTTSIGVYAFSKCNELTNIVVDDKNPTFDSRDNCNAIIRTAKNTLRIGCKNTVIPNNVTGIESCAFYSCDSLTNIEIPKSVTSIGNDAFRDCYNLSIVYNYSSLNIIAKNTEYGYVAYYAHAVANEGDSISYDGDFMFITKGGIHYIVAYTGTESVIELPENYKGENYQIADRAFQSYTKLTSVTIPNGVTSIGVSAFGYSNNLKNIKLGNNIKTIGNGAFWNCAFNSVTIPASVTSIGQQAFGNVPIREVIFEDGDSNLLLGNNKYSDGVGGGLFEYSPVLRVYIGRNLIFSSENDRYGKPSSNALFARWSAGLYAPLKTAIIGPKVTALPKYLFEDCKYLETVISYIPQEKLCSFDTTAEAFLPSNAVLYVPIGAVNTYSATDGWADFGAIKEFTENDNLIYRISSEESKTAEVVTCKGIDSLIEVPKQTAFLDKMYKVESIGDNAFCGCVGVNDVTLANSVKMIGDSAFYYCSALSSIDISNSITKIGDDAFQNCSGLNSVNIKDIAAWCNIEFVDGASNPLNYAKNLYLNEEQVSELVIPDNVNSIGAYAFYGCDGLTSVVISDNVNSIGAYAFYGCDSLTSVVIGNSVARIGKYAFDSHPTKIISLAQTPPTITEYPGFDYNMATLYVPSGAKTAYSTDQYWSKFTDIVEMNPFDLTISNAGYATLYLDYPTEIPEGIKVYTAREVDGNVIKMELVEDVLPANTGVVVKAPAGTYTFTYTATDVPAIPNNLFKGTVVNEYVNVPSNSTAFVLSKVNGEVGMYPAKLTDGSFLNNANKAYLLLANNKLGLSDEELDTSVGGAQLSLRFDFGDTTGVDEVQTETGVNNATYDMYGRKVNTITTPGLYIVNGKKVWVK